MNLMYELQIGFGAFQPISVGFQYGTSRLTEGLRRFAAIMAERNRRARDLGTLASLSERDLRDIGLSRCDAQALLDGTYRR